MTSPLNNVCLIAETDIGVIGLLTIVWWILEIIRCYEDLEKNAILTSGMEQIVAIQIIVSILEGLGQTHQLYNA